ncbi:MAG TPA: Sua5/YciO/YrdC/YwlC family protein [Gammaproteobacteria bacterium]|nr:Sua5/YciO/YrdC/YwlC family protein [Gammaproteobacteria bacterium]
MHTARWTMRRARDVIRGGGVVAYPTEAVYGLGCDPLAVSAIERILTIKSRDAGKGFILIASRIEQLLLFLAPLDKALRSKLEASWPGPVTWIVPAAEGVPDWITGGRDTLAVRVTAHPVARTLCELTGMALISTSANPGGHPPARSAIQVRIRLGTQLDYIVPGHTGPQRSPTEIRDALSGKILRAA